MNRRRRADEPGALAATKARWTGLFVLAIKSVSFYSDRNSIGRVSGMNV
jgi:hypothetical protein